MSAWQHEAACLEEDPELFFPIGNTGPAILQIENAKAVCRRCDVVETCLRWALDTGQDAGVWGGLSEDERRSLKRRKARGRRPRPAPEERAVFVAPGPSVALLQAAVGREMTVKAIAAKCEVAEDTIARLLCGRRASIRDFTAAKIAAAFGQVTAR